MNRPIGRSRLVRPLYRMALVMLLAILGACATAPRGSAPESNYIPDANYYLLMAEIAVQRKVWFTAAEQYLNAAEQSDDPELAQRAAEFAADFGYDTFALSAALRWLELEPDRRIAQEQAGRLYLRNHDAGRAFEHFSAALGADASDEAYLALDADLADEDNAAGVTEIFKQFARQSPDSAGLQAALARAALRSGDSDLALHAARRFAWANPEAYEPQLLVARARMAVGDDLGALALLERLRGESTPVAVELEYIRLLSASGRTSRALAHLAQLARTYGAQPDFVRMHALISLAAQHLDAAEQSFRQLLAAGSDMHECFYYLGRIAVIRGALTEGAGYFLRVRSGPYLIPAQIGATLAYQRRGDREAALDSLAAFAQRYPRHAMALEPTRAQLLFDLGRTGEALAAMRALLMVQPNAVAALLGYGGMLDLLGDRKGALAVMERAVALAPMNPDALNALGYTLTNRTRRHDDAYRLIRTALELAPDSAPILDSMGWVLFRLGRREEALGFLELALAQMADPEIAAHLAEALWGTGERDRARDLLDRFAVLHPDDEALAATRERLRR